MAKYNNFISFLKLEIPVDILISFICTMQEHSPNCLNPNALNDNPNAREQ